MTTKTEKALIELFTDAAQKVEACSLLEKDAPKTISEISAYATTVGGKPYVQGKFEFKILGRFSIKGDFSYSIETEVKNDN